MRTRTAVTAVVAAAALALAPLATASSTPAKRALPTSVKVTDKVSDTAHNGQSQDTIKGVSPFDMAWVKAAKDGDKLVLKVRVHDLPEEDPFYEADNPCSTCGSVQFWFTRPGEKRESWFLGTAQYTWDPHGQAAVVFPYYEPTEARDCDGNADNTTNGVTRRLNTTANTIRFTVPARCFDGDRKFSLSVATSAERRYYDAEGNYASSKQYGYDSIHNVGPFRF